jgi:hypothetical protein
MINIAMTATKKTKKTFGVLKVFCTFAPSKKEIITKHQ